jgi:hypothetical protein
MKYDLWATERNRAEVLPNGCRVSRKTTTKADGTQVYSAQFFLPKATNPVWNHSFRTVLARREAIAKQSAAYDAHLRMKDEQKTARATGDLSLADPGAIFCNSYGYDQTNVHYYQVVRRNGKNVEIAEIGCKTVAGSEYSHGMAEMVVPAKGQFIETCKVCRCSSSLGRQHNDRNDSDFHEFQPHIALTTKRVQFYNGVPGLSFDCGSGSLVKMISFGNADPLPADAHYRSSYH